MFLLVRDLLPRAVFIPELFPSRKFPTVRDDALEILNSKHAQI